MESVMCNDHGKVYGVNSVELFTEARLLNNVCGRRHAYLLKQAKGYHTWLKSQEWCSSPDEMMRAIVARIEAVLDKDSDKVAEYLFQEEEMNNASLLASEFDEFQKSLEVIASKGFRKAFSKEEKLKDLETRLERGKEELVLHNKIQDFLDTLPTYKVEGQYKAVFRRLDVLRNQGKLSWSGWVLFSNQLMSLMGKQPIVSKYEVKDLGDQVQELEKKISALNQEIQEEPEFFMDPHPDADVWIDIQTRLGH
jgi:phosphopantetheinyl transferase (holo-ACP synthase)